MFSYWVSICNRTSSERLRKACERQLLNRQRTLKTQRNTDFFLSVSSVSSVVKLFYFCRSNVFTGKSQCESRISNRRCSSRSYAA